MNFLISTLTLLLFFSCVGQQQKSVELKEPKVYTSADIVTSSLIDKNGNLWFGTTTEGLYKYDGKKFTNFNEDKGLCSNQIWSIITDDKGVIWLATNKGLCKYNGKIYCCLSKNVQLIIIGKYYIGNRLWESNRKWITYFGDPINR